jgi:hypothetical protein
MLREVTRIAPEGMGHAVNAFAKQLVAWYHGCEDGFTSQVMDS